ncbi:MAG TPA: DUF4388 domain-containing protein [Ktedonobacteraceae bacterium]
MTKGRDITAENLNEVLGLARMRRQSGLLSVEHSQGGRLEEGEIFFQDGQPTYARVGQLIGQDAVNWLLTWRNVHFAFITDVPRPPANIAPITGPVTTSSRVPRLDANTSLDEGSPLNRNSSNSVARPNPTPPLPPPGIEWLVPQKRRVGEDVLSLPLTRRQRYIYFLVDGRRSVSDLSRTTGRTIQEVELVLRELQEQGLISV